MLEQVAESIGQSLGQVVNVINQRPLNGAALIKLAVLAWTMVQIIYLKHNQAG